MKRVSWQKQLSLQFRCPTGFDKAEIKILVRPINLVANDRMSEMRKMDANLMGPAGARECAHDRELFRRVLRTNETSFGSKLCARGRSLRVNRLL